MKIDSNGRIPDLSSIRGGKKASGPESAGEASKFDEVASFGADTAGDAQVSELSPEAAALRARLLDLSPEELADSSRSVQAVVESALEAFDAVANMPEAQRGDLSEALTDFLHDDPAMNQRIQRLVGQLVSAES